MKQLNKKIISTSILFVILSIWFNVLCVKNESFAATDEDIYDVKPKDKEVEDVYSMIDDYTTYTVEISTATYNK